MKKAARYETEAALCADFIAWVKRSAGQFNHGIKTPTWTPYAETAGWDILLVGADGTQIGIQAKLRFNLKVIEQSVPDGWSHWHDHGPDYRAILIPERDSAHDKICAALGLMLFARSGYSYFGEGNSPEFAPGLNMEHSNGWHYWSPRRRCELPEFVPDVVAGASGPVQLTKWKVAALRVVARLQIRGHVTRQDFRELGVDPRRWTGPNGWLAPSAQPSQFVRGAGLDFDAQHPEVFAEVLAEQREKLASLERRAA